MLLRARSKLISNRTQRTGGAPLKLGQRLPPKAYLAGYPGVERWRVPPTDNSRAKSWSMDLMAHCRGHLQVCTRAAFRLDKPDPVRHDDREI